MQLPRSKFVCDTIKQLPFNADSRAYVHDLLRIEHNVIHGPGSWAGAMLDHQLREKYRGVYGVILRELNPSRHERERRTRATLARQRSEYAAREAAARKLQREDDRKIWQQVCGLVSS